MLKIWGRTNSANVQKVMWTVEEVGVKHERVEAGMKFGVVNEPWYRDMNPNGLVPTIQDGDFTLWESNAIVRYLASKYADGSLYPKSPEARADADRWMDWCTSTMAPTMGPVFIGLVRTPPEQRDAKAIEAARVKLDQLMSLLDAHLARRRFMAGDSFTMGDIPPGCFVHRWYVLPIERAHYPNLLAWYERLKQRPAFRTHVMAIPLT
ncbi:MAG TPA: glutathione S-transferase [Burkholderiales bacterium]|nr:glutathione S-transferase [Burkholderiales bacterium]